MDEQHEESYFNSGTTDFLKKYGLQKIHYSFFDKFRFILTAGLGLIAALAWDESLRSIFHELFPTINSGLGSLLYALFLTILATLVSLVLTAISKRSKNKS